VEKQIALNCRSKTPVANCEILSSSNPNFKSDGEWRLRFQKMLSRNLLDKIHANSIGHCDLPNVFNAEKFLSIQRFKKNLASH
jgi:hypothetical protein